MTASATSLRAAKPRGLVAGFKKGTERGPPQLPSPKRAGKPAGPRSSARPWLGRELKARSARLARSAGQGGARRESCLRFSFAAPAQPPAPASRLTLGESWLGAASRRGARGRPGRSCPAARRGPRLRSSARQACCSAPAQPGRRAGRAPRFRLLFAARSRLGRAASRGLPASRRPATRG